MSYNGGVLTWYTLLIGWVLHGLLNNHVHRAFYWLIICCEFICGKTLGAAQCLDLLNAVVYRSEFEVGFIEIEIIGNMSV